MFSQQCIGFLIVCSTVYVCVCMCIFDYMCLSLLHIQYQGE